MLLLLFIFEINRYAQTNKYLASKESHRTFCDYLGPTKVHSSTHAHNKFQDLNVAQNLAVYPCFKNKKYRKQSTHCAH